MDWSAVLSEKLDVVDMAIIFAMPAIMLAITTATLFAVRMRNADTLENWRSNARIARSGILAAGLTPAIASVAIGSRNPHTELPYLVIAALITSGISSLVLIARDNAEKLCSRIAGSGDAAAAYDAWKKNGTVP